MKRRVLIIDDEPWQAAVYQRVLSDVFHVEHVTNGFAAIERFDQARPDMVILDVLLAGTTAWTLLNELQSHSDLASIPVLLVTNSSDIETKYLAAYGVVGLLDKATMHPNDIRREVEKVLA